MPKGRFRGPKNIEAIKNVKLITPRFNKIKSVTPLSPKKHIPTFSRPTTGLTALRMPKMRLDPERTITNITTAPQNYNSLSRQDILKIEAGNGIIPLIRTFYKTREDIISFLHILHRRIIGEMNDKIHTVIPVDTGDLRQSIIESLENVRIYEYGMVMHIESDLPYANVVRGMTNTGRPHVRHKNQTGGRSGYLHDPQAVAKYDRAIERELRRIMERIWVNELEKEFGTLSEIQQVVPAIRRYSQLFRYRTYVES